MDQKLVILRGAPCSGKTTIAEKLRDYDKRIAWVSIDKIKPTFSDFEDRTLDEAQKTALVILQDLLGRDFSVVIDGIFKKSEHIQGILQIAQQKNISITTYQLTCSLETLKERDKSRDGVKHGLYAPMGDTLIESLYNTVQENPIEGAIEIDTEKNSVEEIVGTIRKSII